MFIVGQTINDYKIIGTLGSPGGFGQAHRVRHLQNGSEAALKECLKLDADSLQRFDSENNILYSLQSHDFIIKPLSKVAVEGSTKYYLMELADENLEDFLNRNYNLRLDEKMDLFIKICEGIAHAHSKDVVHRDIWWKNVLLIHQPKPSTPKLTDFGRSRNFNLPQVTPIPPVNWGLPDISQPELYFKYWDTPSEQNYILGDIYALGVLLYYSLEVGSLPYFLYLYPSATKYLGAKNININVDSETTRQQAYKDWLATIDYNHLNNLRHLPSIDVTFRKKIDPIIEKMSNPDFSLRYQSMGELLVDLRGV